MSTTYDLGRGIGLIIAKFTSNWRAYQLACNLKRIFSPYSRAGFIIQTILMNMEFKRVMPEIPKVVVITSTTLENVAKVERRIRVIKERCWACMAVLNFKIIPNFWQSIGYIFVFLAKCYANENEDIINLQSKGTNMPWECLGIMLKCMKKTQLHIPWTQETIQPFVWYQLEIFRCQLNLCVLKQE